jgi:hypothetical protein
MDFIGCTHIGTSQKKPVTIFEIPPKNKAGAREIALSEDNATRRGRSVPRSPSDPDISESVRESIRNFDLLRNHR